MPQSFTLGTFSTVVLSFLRFGVAFVPPAHNRGQQLTGPAVKYNNVIQRDDACATLGSRSSSTSSTSASTSSTSHGGAKESFLRNLERKRAGEDIPSSVLDADLARLGSLPEHDLPTTAAAAAATTTTTVDNLESWRGRWRICHAPHIDTLGGLILTSFPHVEYNFQSSDGRMISHSRYESKLFGSGWLNADGRVVPLKQQKKEPRAGGVVGDVVRQKAEEVVQVRVWLGYMAFESSSSGKSSNYQGIVELTNITLGKTCTKYRAYHLCTYI